MYCLAAHQGLLPLSRRDLSARCLRDRDTGARLAVFGRRNGVRSCVKIRAAKEGASTQEQTVKPYTARLQSNPAYQRLKALKQQPTESGPPPPPAVARALEQAPPQEKPKQEEQHVPPQAGLKHRQRDRPVGQQSPGPTKDDSPGANRFAGPQPPESPQKPQQPPARSTLQPQSAVQQSPYASRPSAPARHADFAENASAQQKTMSTVQFWLTFHAEFGQKLRVVGSHKNLGSWIMVEGPELHWTEGDRWHAAISLPAGGVFEYKYVLLDSSGTHALTWQRGNNSVLAIKQDEAEIEVFDNWEGQPGAAVMAGGKSSTRESKLLAWATDIESQLSVQRQELRRTRMELAEAQEDARRARQEARAVRMELAQSQSVRAQADILIRELQSSNRLLKSELQATTTSFKQALHVAQSMLDTAEERDLDSEEESASQSEDTDTESLATDIVETAEIMAVTASEEEEEEEDGGKQEEEEGDKLEQKLSSQSQEHKVTGQQEPIGAVGLAASGMKGQAVESTTSSNARQSTTATVTSPQTSPVSPSTTSGPAVQNTQAETQSVGTEAVLNGHPKQEPARQPASIGDSLSEQLKQQSAESATTNGQDLASSQAEFASQPDLGDLPKHGKLEKAAASPPQAPGTFPDSEGPLKYLETQRDDQSAGTQLETARTAVPEPADKTNEAASRAVVVEKDQTQLADQKSGPDTPAGKELEEGKEAIPDNPVTPSTASKRPATPKGSKRPSTPNADRPATPKATKRPATPKAAGWPKAPKATEVSVKTTTDQRPATPKGTKRPAIPKHTKRPDTPKAVQSAAVPGDSAGPDASKATRRPDTAKNGKRPATPRAAKGSKADNGQQDAVASSESLQSTEKLTSKSSGQTPSSEVAPAK